MNRFVLVVAALPAMMVTTANAACSRSGFRRRWANKSSWKTAAAYAVNSTPDQSAAGVRPEIGMWSKVIKEAGIKAD
jgi:hypothetical protein